MLCAWLRSRLSANRKIGQRAPRGGCACRSLKLCARLASPAGDGARSAQCLDFVRPKPQVAVLHEIRMLVVAFVADVHAMSCRIAAHELLALAIGQAVNRARLVEQADGRATCCSAPAGVAALGEPNTLRRRVR